MFFELIPTDLQEQIEFYELKLKDFEQKAKWLIENNYEIPRSLLSLGLNTSVLIRNLKYRLENEVK